MEKKDLENTLGSLKGWHLGKALSRNFLVCVLVIFASRKILEPGSIAITQNRGAKPRLIAIVLLLKDTEGEVEESSDEEGGTKIELCSFRAFPGVTNYCWSDAIIVLA